MSLDLCSRPFWPSSKFTRKKHMSTPPKSTAARAAKTRLALAQAHQVLRDMKAARMQSSARPAKPTPAPIKTVTAAEFTGPGLRMDRDQFRLLSPSERQRFLGQGGKLI